MHLLIKVCQSGFLYYFAYQPSVLVELRFRGRVVAIVCYRFCFYTPMLHHYANWFLASTVGPIIDDYPVTGAECLGALDTSRRLRKPIQDHTQRPCRLRCKILRVLLSLGKGTCRKRLLEHWLSRESYGRESERVWPLPWRERRASILLRQACFRGILAS